MAIKSVEAIPFAIKEPTERELAYGKLTARRNVIVQIRDDSGMVGTAETAPIPIQRNATTSAVTRWRGYAARPTEIPPAGDGATAGRGRQAPRGRAQAAWPIRRSSFWRTRSGSTTGLAR